MTVKHPEDKHAPRTRSWLERLTALLAREPQNKDQLMDVLRDAEERHVLSTEMLGMIERILQVSEMQVREVMVPKTQMVMIRNNSPLQAVLPIVIESGHSRFPVFDPSDGNIIGILLAKDILKYFFNKEANQFNIADILRPLVFIPQNKRLNILLREFRINRNHMAIVLDEYGHATGLVTIEDVLEQIVGEIEDEYDIDKDDVYIKKHDDDSYIVKAKTPISQFNHYFAADFQGGPDTIGRLVLNSFDHLPKRGESIKLKHFRFSVLHSDNQQIYLLEVKKTKKGRKHS